MTATSDDITISGPPNTQRASAFRTFILAWILLMLLRFNYGDSSGQTLRIPVRLSVVQR
ncbi:hypothetical protein [Azonexus hydrophilus]